MEDRPTKRQRVDRVLAACDLCKKRKVKCDGVNPCGYCVKRKRGESCTFSRTTSTPVAPHFETAQGVEVVSVNGDEVRTPRRPAEAPTAEHASSRPLGDHTGTAVPLDSGLISDLRGKAIFIGDSAPMSFLRTVRHLIATEIDVNGSPARDSMIEIASPETHSSAPLTRIPTVEHLDVNRNIHDYSTATNGLVDLFHGKSLEKDVESWKASTPQCDTTISATYFLILAISTQETTSTEAEAWFSAAKDTIQRKMCSDADIHTVQGFILITLFLLRSSQPNSAYLYLAMAARTAYTLGIHRSEVNASFGDVGQEFRDRIWKSLRTVDIFISSLLGRPTATSDIDCSVKYRIAKHNAHASAHIIDASVQVLMIIERVVIEVYSRKRISLRIADFVSRQLKSWALDWLKDLNNVIHQLQTCERTQAEVVGACHVICSYYYGILLLTRPFLIYDLYESLGATISKAPGTRTENDEKRRYADAAIDAAIGLATTLRTMVDAGYLPKKMPLVVSWLFTASLSLTIAIVGRSGRSLESHCRSSIECLEHFAYADPNARQYSNILTALLATTTEYARRSESRLRDQRREASSQLFGMLPAEPQVNPRGFEFIAPVQSPEIGLIANPIENTMEPSSLADWTIYDSDFPAVPWLNQNVDTSLQDFLQPARPGADRSSADVPLFPLNDQSTLLFENSSGTMM